MLEMSANWLQVGQWLVTFLVMQTNNNNNADAVHSEPVRVRLIECYESSEGVIHIHADGCRDIGRWERASFDGVRVGTSFTAGETVAEATLGMAADFNSDFAGDEGMSSMDYVAEGMGYPINVLPCAVKVIKEHM